MANLLYGATPRAATETDEEHSLSTFVSLGEAAAQVLETLRKKIESGDGMEATAP